MKRFLKNIFLIFVALFCCFSGFVSGDPWQLEGRAGVFILQSSAMRKTLHNALPYFELEGSYRMFQCWDTWGSVGCFFGEGHTRTEHRRVDVQVTNVALGVSRFFCITPSIEAFLSAGGLWGIYTNQGYVPFAHRHILSNAFGGIVKGGYYYRWCDCCAISIFGEYMMLQFRCHDDERGRLADNRNRVNMNGGSVGVGFLYDF